MTVLTVEQLIANHIAATVTAQRLFEDSTLTVKMLLGRAPEGYVNYQDQQRIAPPYTAGDLKAVGAFWHDIRMVKDFVGSAVMPQTVFGEACQIAGTDVIEQYPGLIGKNLTALLPITEVVSYAVMGWCFDTYPEEPCDADALNALISKIHQYYFDGRRSTAAARPTLSVVR